MHHKRQAEFLDYEIETVLGYVKHTPSLYDLVRESLSKVQWKLTSQGASCHPWSLLPLTVCEVICDKFELALPAGASLQLLRAAAEVFDDIEDADSPTSLSAKYGPAVATNVATTLLILAERAIARLELKSVDNRTIIRVTDVINSHYTTACAGQHLDLSLKTGTTISEDTYLNIVKMKSASAIECACLVGALLGNASKKLIDDFGEFGQNLGIASQIANDILGITHKRDIIKSKVTLPVIYALSQTDSDIRHQLEQAFNQPHMTVAEPEKIKDLLFSSGAIQYATIKMELYKQRAQDILFSIHKEGVNVGQLQLFLK